MEKQRISLLRCQKVREELSSAWLVWARRFFIQRHFALLWSGQTVSKFGSYITSIGLPIAALLILHATPAQMGLLIALGSLPGLLIGLFIGVWIDRLPRCPVMIAAYFGRAVLLALIPLAALLGLLHLAWLYLVAVLVGLLALCSELASRSFLPTLLSPDKLAIGNSRLGISDALAEIGGPPLAGLLIQWLTAPVAIVLDALSLLFSACCICLIRFPEPPRTTSDQRLPFWQEMGEGLTLLVQEPILRSLAAYLCTFNFFGGAFAALYLLYTVQLFGSSVFAYSIFVASGGLGALVGSICATFVTRRFGRGRTLIGSALLSGLFVFCTPIASGPAPLVFALLAGSQLIGDSSFAIYAVNEVSLRQALIPDHLLGRVNASIYMLSNGALPLGALAAGLLSEVIGVRLTLLVGASGIFLASSWLVFSPLRHNSQSEL